MNKSDRYDTTMSSLFAGIVDLFRRSEPIGSLSENDRIDGKTCLVTGGSSGLGRAVAVELVRRGGKVIVASRNADLALAASVRGDAERESIQIARKAGRASLVHVPEVRPERIDLLSFESVLAFVERLSERGEKLDIAVFNAGAVTAGARQSRDGIDAMLQTNYIAKYLLVRKLFEGDCFRLDPTAGVPRLIFVSSEAHRSSPDIDIGSFPSVEPYTMAGAVRHYAYSKLLLTTFTEELERRLGRDGRPSASVLTLCPGAVNSRIAREAPTILRPLLKLIFSILFRSPRRAAEPVVFLACSPSVEGKSGLYLHLMTPKEKDERACDVDLGRRLWEESERILQTHFPGQG
jgi:NAD(P)-dependent dehydrogenase (short-subunit alcohol dehydrogenase family)